MCHAVALSECDVPAEWIDGGRMGGRVHRRGGDAELRFCWWNRPAELPVLFDGRLQLVAWGNKGRTEPRLPVTGWTWRETVEAGRWAALAPRPVVIPAVYGFAGGVWFRVRVGMRGLLVDTPAGDPVVYMLCEPATRYYRVMTRAEWMPVLVDEVI